jgi:hypothetical protein
LIQRFHEFVAQLLQWGRQGDVAYVPAMRTQLVAARSVAEAVVDLTLDESPAGGPIWKVAGPREERLAGPDLRGVARRRVVLPALLDVLGDLVRVDRADVLHRRPVQPGQGCGGRVGRRLLG